MIVYPEIQRRLEEAGMSYTDLADILGLTRQGVYRRMHGLAKWTLNDALRVCETFNTYDIRSLFQLVV